MIRYYKGKPDNKGCACTFWLNTEHNTFWASLLKQHSWDAKKKIGHFKASNDDQSKKAVVKFSEFEICKFIDSIKNDTTFDGYHGSQAQIIKFKFEPYKADKFQGFILRVQKEDKEDSTNKVNFSMGFSTAEALRLAIYFENALSRIDNESFQYAPDKDNRNSNKSKQSSAPKDDFDDDDDIF